MTYRETPGAPARLDPRAKDPLDDLTRRIYRAQTGSDGWKELRWLAETKLAPSLQSRPVTRNALINAPVSALAASSGTRVEVDSGLLFRSMMWDAYFALAPRAS